MSDRRKQKLISCAVWTSETQAREAQYALEMGEKHLDFLPAATGFRVLRSCGVRTGYVASIFVQIPRDLSGKSVWAALGFEFADVAIQFAGAINPRSLGRYAASGGRIGSPELNQFFACGAGVAVAFGVEGKVGAGERAIGSI